MENFKFDSKITGFRIKDKLKNTKERVVATDVKLPTDSPARVKVLKAEGKKWYLTVVYHENTEQPFALFCHTNHREKSAQTSDAVTRLEQLAHKKGILDKHIDKTMGKIENDNNVSKLTRLLSLLLRHGVAISSIVAELDKMEDIFVGSFLFQIKKFLGQYIQDGEEVQGAGCLDCGGTLVYSEGCMSCLDCGSSKCG